jgi:hypothetical protein
MNYLIKYYEYFSGVMWIKMGYELEFICIISMLQIFSTIFLFFSLVPSYLTSASRNPPQTCTGPPDILTYPKRCLFKFFPKG